jgi:hypothetical protein
MHVDIELPASQKTLAWAVTQTVLCLCYLWQPHGVCVEEAVCSLLDALRGCDVIVRALRYRQVANSLWRRTSVEAIPVEAWYGYGALAPKIAYRDISNAIIFAHPTFRRFPEWGGDFYSCPTVSPDDVFSWLAPAIDRVRQLHGERDYRMALSHFPVSAAVPALPPLVNAATLRKKGRPANKRRDVITQMQGDIETGRLTPERLRSLLEKEMEARYEASRDTVRKARIQVLGG